MEFSLVIQTVKFNTHTLLLGIISCSYIFN